jgi:hypothetical protein
MIRFLSIVSLNYLEPTPNPSQEGIPARTGRDFSPIPTPVSSQEENKTFLVEE